MLLMEDNFSIEEKFHTAYMGWGGDGRNATACVMTNFEGACRVTVELSSERVTDDNVPVNGKRQHEQLGLVLRHEKQHVEQLAGDRQVVELYVVVKVEEVNQVDDKKEQTIGGQGNDVDGRRVATSHRTHEPDGRRQAVTDHADHQPDVEDHQVERECAGDEVFVEQSARVALVHRLLSRRRDAICR